MVFNRTVHMYRCVPLHTWQMRYGSLFSGIGGFDLAAQWMGWQIKFLCESNAYCRKILRRHFGDARLIHDVRDIYRFTDEYEDVYGDREVMWCERHKMDFAECACIGCSQWDDEVGEIDVLTGGFPCVDITNAKNAAAIPRGIEGEQSKLWFEYKRIVGVLRPRWAIVENSATLNVRGLDVVASGFAGLGYGCIWFNVPACRVGAPHLRERLFIVAHPDGTGLERAIGLELAHEVKRRFDANAGRPTWWRTEPKMDRVVDGLSARVDRKRDRLNGLGNAVVPQVAYEIYKAIESVEDNLSKQHFKK